MKSLVTTSCLCLLLTGLLGCQESDDQLAVRLTELHRVDHSVPTNEPDPIYGWIVPVAGRPDLAVAVYFLDGIHQGGADVVERDSLNILCGFGGGQTEHVVDISTRRVQGGSIVRFYTTTARSRLVKLNVVLIHDDNTVEGLRTVSFVEQAP